MGTIIIVVIVLVIVVLAVWLIASYNGLVKLKNRVEAAWAQIEVQLNRRHDLIPNLVETVKGYATHESETLEKVVAARNSAVAASTPSEQANAEKAVSGALANVFALSEAYPDLKANQNFLALQEELTTSEDRVAYARQYYNDSVNQYNTKIESFPAVFMARAAGMGERQYFQAEGDARGPVTVSF
ncbi:LemA family protein [Iamia sp.]|uniref:LemA family protein n=1 Tax=Iamia sp. TaxID=2722710 RepID=UPI002C156649|nr:LemA family protein [Iamia sp.]HXH57746.1 LemA family protein [Iamia sp.]